LDAKGRAAQEAKLAELQHKVEEVQRAERERKYSVMYHRVKFFDRVKVERRVKQLEKVLKEAVLEGDEETVKVSTDNPATSTNPLIFTCMLAHRLSHAMPAHLWRMTGTTSITDGMIQLKA
jgi:hypothetical protein